MYYYWRFRAAFLVVAGVVIHARALQVERYDVTVRRGSSGSVEALSNCTKVTLISQFKEHDRIVELEFHPKCEGPLRFSHLGSLEPNEFVLEFVAQNDTIAYVIAVHFNIIESVVMNKLFRTGPVAALRINQTLSTALHLNRCQARLVRLPQFKQLSGTCGKNLYEWQQCEDFTDVHYSEHIDLDDFVIGIKRDGDDEQTNVIVYLLEKLQSPEPTFASTLQVEVTPNVLSPVSHIELSTDDAAAFFRVLESPENCGFFKANSRTRILQFSPHEIDNFEIALKCDSVAPILEIRMDLVNILGEASDQKFSLSLRRTDFNVDVSYDDLLVNGNTSATLLVRSSSDVRLWTVEGLTRGVLLNEALRPVDQFKANSPLRPVDQFKANSPLRYRSSAKEISTDNLVLKPDQSTFRFLVPIIVVPGEIHFFLTFDTVTVTIGRSTAITKDLFKYPKTVYLGELVFSVNKPLPAQGEFILNGKRTTRFTFSDVRDLRLAFRSSAAAKAGSEEVLIVCENSMFSASVLTTVRYTHGKKDRSYPRKAKNSDLQMKVGSPGSERVALERSHLNYEDSSSEGNTCSQHVLFKITSPLSDPANPSSSSIGEIADEAGNRLSEFTQKDVNLGRVFYYPPSYVLDRLQPRSLKFEFSVSDRYGNKVNSHKFYIYLDSVKIEKTFFFNVSSASPVHILGENIMNSTYNVSSSRFMLTEAPQHGALKDPENEVLIVGDIFTFNELLHGGIRYVPHYKSANDSLELTVYDYDEPSDSAKKKYSRVKLNFLPHDSSSHDTERLDGTTWRMKLPEGSTKSMVIGGSQFLVVVDPPDHGVVHVSEDRSSAGMINITYAHAGDEVGLHIGLDSFALQNEQGTHIRIEVQILPVDNSPPQVTLPLELSVPEGGNVSLGLAIKDVDSLHFKCDITEPSNLGYLASSQGFVLSFTGENVDSLFYVQNLHYQQEPRKDSLSFVCSDSVNVSPESKLSIDILPVNDEQPYLSVEEVTVLEGRIAPIKMKVTDRDIPQDKLFLTVTKHPNHGTVGLLKANGEVEKVDQFANIEAHRVAYQHDGSEINTDLFELTLSDGTHNLSVSAPVHVLAVDDEMPYVVHNHEVELDARGFRKLSGDDLKSVDKDTPAEKITYIVLTEPRYGQIFKDDDRTVKFTQEDIENQRVSYRNSWKLCCVNDTFSFKVTDGFNTSPKHNFSLTILPPSLKEAGLKPKSIVLSSTSFIFDPEHNSFSAPLEGKDLSKDGIDLLWILRPPINGDLQFNDGEKPVLRYSIKQEAVTHFRTKDSFNLLLRTDSWARENVSVSTEWCWLVLAVEDDEGFLGDQLNVTVTRRGVPSTTGMTLMIGQNRLPLTLNRDQNSLSLQVEVPPAKEKVIELKLISEKPGCLIHPDSRKVFPVERLRSSLTFEHAGYTVQEPRNGTMRVFLKVIRSDKLTTPIKFIAETQQQASGATSGTDYVPLHQDFEVAGLSRSVLIPLKILSDRDTEDDEAFSVVLKEFESQRPLVKATVSIIDAVSSDQSLTSPPVILSLNEDGNFFNHTTSLNRGYPAICVIECDRRHPSFSPQSPLCARLEFGSGPALSVSVRWKWALHSSDELEPLFPPANVNFPGRLESFLLVPGSRISCSVRLQLAPVNGQLGKGRGEERESLVYHVTNEGVCSKPEQQADLGADPYTSSLSIVEGSSLSNPRIRLVVTIPHRDGLLPLVSTSPISKSVLTSSVAASNHPCSNFANFSSLQSTLSLRSCSWRFHRLFSLEQLEKVCNAERRTKLFESSEEQQASIAQHHGSTVTLSLPLHVAYFYRTPCPSPALARWRHVSLSNVVQLSFLSNEQDANKTLNGGTVELEGVKLSSNGHLQLRFRSVSILDGPGRLVLNKNRENWNSTLIEAKSTSSSTKVSLKIHLQPSLSSTQLEWMIESLEPVSRFQGNISFTLFPCVYSKDSTEKCSEMENEQPLDFYFPIQIEAPKNPQELTYALKSEFSLTRDKSTWLHSDNTNKNAAKTFHDTFLEGDLVYGKIRVVFEDTGAPVFQANIERCYLCSSLKEISPSIHKDKEQPCDDHTQMDCFLKILDFQDPYSVDTHLSNTPFNAIMMSLDPISFDPEVLEAIRSTQKADGFIFQTEPLFAQQRASTSDNLTFWNVHCIFTVSAHPHAKGGRERRSVSFPLVPEPGNLRESSAPLNLQRSTSTATPGSNLLRFFINLSNSSSRIPLVIFSGSIIALALLLLILSVVKFGRRAPRYQQVKTSTTSNNNQIVTMHVFPSNRTSKDKLGSQEKIVYPRLAEPDAF